MIRIKKPFLKRLVAAGLVVVAMASTSCAPRPAPSSLSATQKARLSELRQQYSRRIPPTLHMILSDGADIPFRVWEARRPPAAIILALHGANDSRDAWELSAPLMAARGITVYAPDQRGFGETAQRSHWPGADTLIHDAAEEARRLAAMHPGVPLYLMGESMGAAVLLCLDAQAGAPPVAGYILLAPAVITRRQIGLAGDIALQLLNLTMPGVRLGGDDMPVHVVASDNALALYRNYLDPLSLRTARVEVIKGLVDLMTMAAAQVPYIRHPTLVVYGGHDQIVPPASMRAVWEHFPPFTRKDIVPGGYHLLLRDHGRALVVDDVLSWINHPQRWLPSGGDMAASVWPGEMAGRALPPFFLPARLDMLP